MKNRTLTILLLLTMCYKYPQDNKLDMANALDTGVFYTYILDILPENTRLKHLNI